MTKKTKRQLLRELDKVDAKLINKSALKERRIINKQLDEIEKQEVQSKKQSWFWRVGWLICILILLAGATIIDGTRNSTSYICSKNPEKCLWEAKEKYSDLEIFRNEDGTTHSAKEVCGKNNDINILATFCQLRLKTQAEFDIDDCNNNPREDEKCKCEEEYILRCLNEGRYLFEKDNISFDILLKPNQTGMKPHSFCYPKPTIIEESGAILKEILYEDIWIAESRCLKSRPKTECEKGNPDWVEKNQYLHSDGIYYDWCEPEDIVKGTCLNKHHTICREKTDEEKRFEEICKQTINYKVKNAP